MTGEQKKNEGNTGRRGNNMNILVCDDDKEIVERIKEHPMAIWKCQQ